MVGRAPVWVKGRQNPQFQPFQKVGAITCGRLPELARAGPRAGTHPGVGPASGQPYSPSGRSALCQAGMPPLRLYTVGKPNEFMVASTSALLLPPASYSR